MWYRLEIQRYAQADWEHWWTKDDKEPLIQMMADIRLWPAIEAIRIVAVTPPPEHEEIRVLAEWSKRK